jgi:hypothetical protein
VLNNVLKLCGKPGNYLKSLVHIILTATIHPNISKIVRTVHRVLKNINSTDIYVNWFNYFKITKLELEVLRHQNHIVPSIFRPILSVE